MSSTSENLPELKRRNYRQTAKKLEQQPSHLQVASPTLDETSESGVSDPLAKRGNPMLQTIRAGLVAKASWCMRDAKEEEVRKAFQDMTLPEALNVLAQGRKNLEIAATVINQRLGDEAAKETCSTCGGPPRRNGMWVLQGVDKDKETGLLVPYRYCDVICVRERNKKRLLPEGHSGTRVDGQDMGDIR